MEELGIQWRIILIRDLKEIGWECGDRFRVGTRGGL